MPLKSIPWKWVRRGALVATLMVSTGCGRQQHALPLGEVEGVVTLDGKPYAGALVEFNPRFDPADDEPSPDKKKTDKKKRKPRFAGSLAVTGPDGKYILKFNNELKGAVVGEHSVKVTDLPIDDDGSTVKKKPPTTRKYRVKSSTTVDVLEGQNQVDVELVSNKPSDGRGTLSN